MYNGNQITETFPRNSLFIESDTRRDRWAVPYHYEALNARVDNIIIRNKQAIAEKRILDLGCHFGTFAYAALQHGALSVKGVDAEMSLIEKARDLFLKHNAPKFRYDFVCDDVVRFLESQEDNSFDTVLCLGLLYYLGDTVHCLKEMKRVARSHIIIDTFTAYYAPCVSKEGEKMFQSTRDETFELPIMLYPFTQAGKADYSLKDSFLNKKKKSIGMLSLPSIPALENFFDLLHLTYSEIPWDRFYVNNYSWKDLIDNDIKKTSHWADVYHAKVRVAYLLSK